jgi:hypothetical protein
VTEPVEAYLADLRARLPGPPALRRGVLAEVADGLRCAAEDHEARGLVRRDAEQAAAAEFGSPAALARDLAPELLAARARRVALGLLRSGPVLGLVWLAVAATGVPSRTLPAVVLAAAPLLPVAIAATVLAAIVVVVATRSPAPRPRVALHAAAAAALAVVMGDLALLTGLPGLQAPGAGPLLVLAATASVVRLVLSTWSLHTCLATPGR